MLYVVTGLSPRRPLRRLGFLLVAAALVSAVPGIAVASLPAHPAPTHDCCLSGEPMPADAPCDTAPCCLSKPAPRAPSLLTGAVPLPLLAAVAVVAEMPVAPAESAAAPGAVVPRARSAPLYLLFVTLLN